MRTIVDLPDKQLAALAAFCDQEGISRAEAVRRAIDALLAVQQPLLQQGAFGAWEPRGDARNLVKRLRDEWPE